MHFRIKLTLFYSRASKLDFEGPKHPTDEAWEHQILHKWLQNRQGHSQVSQKGAHGDCHGAQGVPEV